MSFITDFVSYLYESFIGTKEESPAVTGEEIILPVDGKKKRRKTFARKLKDKIKKKQLKRKKRAEQLKKQMQLNRKLNYVDHNIQFDDIAIDPEYWE